MSELFTVAELNEHERITLIALLRASVFSDGSVSDEEHEQIQAIASEMGEEVFEAASIKAEEQGRNIEELYSLVEKVERREAQELIYAALLSAAAKDSIDDGEADILELIENNWDVDVSFPDPPDELREDDDDEA